MLSEIKKLEISYNNKHWSKEELIEKFKFLAPKLGTVYYKYKKYILSVEGTPCHFNIYIHFDGLEKMLVLKLHYICNKNSLQFTSYENWDLINYLLD